MKPGEEVETVPKPRLTTTGASPKKAPAQWGGTATATALAPDVGVSQAEPLPAAATPGSEAAVQILQTRALRTPAPTGETQPTDLKLRITVRAGVSQ